MSFFKNFLRPRPNPFYALLTEQAECASKALKMLESYMKSGEAASVNDLHSLEKEADEVRRILIDELNRTFVTPFDREDIFNLSRAIDDVVDYADTTVDEMALLTVEPNQYLIRTASLLREAGDELLLAVRQIKDHPGVANDHCQRAKALENRVETVYREAIAELFRGAADSAQILRLLKLREVYRHLSNAADRGDEAANIISSIVVKIG